MCTWTIGCPAVTGFVAVTVTVVSKMNIDPGPLLVIAKYKPFARRTAGNVAVDHSGFRK